MNALITAAQAVIENWEGTGNLAGAVHNLEGELTNIERATFEEIDCARNLIDNTCQCPSDIEVDDDALRSSAEDGVWVQAWIYVSREALE